MRDILMLWTCPTTVYSLLPDTFILCCFGPKIIISDFEVTVWWGFPKTWQPLINIRWLKNDQANALRKFLRVQSVISVNGYQ